MANIVARVISGDPTVPGSTFTVRVRVESNFSGEIPGAFYLQVLYNPSAVQYVSSSAGFAGPYFDAAGTPIAPYSVRRCIHLGGSSTATNPTPTLLNMTFRVLDDPVFPHSIIVEKEGQSEQAIISADFRRTVPSVFHNGLVTDLGASP